MRLLAALVLLLVQVPAYAEDEAVRIGLNCGYWNTALAGDAALVAKVLFVRGMYEGATAFHMDIFDAAERDAQSSQAGNTQQAAQLFEQRYLRQTSYLALVSGLDEFCRDPQNETVWLAGAIKVVSMRLRGEPADALEMEIQRLRAEPGP